MDLWKIWRMLATVYHAMLYSLLHEYCVFDKIVSGRYLDTSPCRCSILRQISSVHKAVRCDTMRLCTMPGGRLKGGAAPPSCAGRRLHQRPQIIRRYERVISLIHWTCEGVRLAAPMPAASVDSEASSLNQSRDMIF